MRLQSTVLLALLAPVAPRCLLLQPTIDGTRWRTVEWAECCRCTPKLCCHSSARPAFYTPSAVSTNSVQRIVLVREREIVDGA
jgi:hypothetical protein